MPLLASPNEILITIAEELEQSSLRDIYFLLLANRRLASICLPILHRAAAKDLPEMTALQWAILAGHESLVRILLEWGAVVDFSCHCGARPGNMMVMVCSRSIAKSSLERSSNRVLRDSCGMTPFHLVLKYGSEMMVQLFWEKGVGAQVGDGGCGNPWIILAAQWRNISAVKVLLKNGVDVNERDDKDRTALLWVIQTNDVIKEGVDSYIILDLLLQHGADISVQDIYGRTALYYATIRGYEEVIRQLLDWGASVSEANQDGRTLLHYAAGCGVERVVYLLLERGADPTARDFYGYTAFDFIKRRKIGGRTSPAHRYLVKLLLKSIAFRRWTTDGIVCGNLD